MSVWSNVRNWFTRKPKPPVTPPPPPGGPTFSDTFAGGQLDIMKWMKAQWTAPGLNGTFSPLQVDLSSGMLRLAMTTSVDGKHIGAEVQSYQKFGYGTYEWVARMGSSSPTPDGAGVSVSGGVSGLFNFLNDSETEIDFEALGDKPQLLFLTNWNKPQSIGISQQASDVTPNVALSATFNRFKFVWQPGSIQFYVNDQLYMQHNLNIPTQPAHVIMNHWGSNDPGWGGYSVQGTRYLYVRSFSFTASTP